MAYPVTQLYVPGINSSLTNAQYNAEFQNVYTNVGNPQNIDDYSTNLAQMQVQTDPGEIGTESQAITIAEELERLRFAVKDAKQFMDPGVTYWYETPTTFSPSLLTSLVVTSTSDVDVVTISANIDPYTSDLLVIQTREEDSGSFNFIKCTSDTDGSPLDQFVVDQGGNITCGNITCGSITTTGFLTIDASSGIQADKLVLAEDGTGANTITLQGPDSASTTTHVLTLPGALPAADAFVLVDNLGAVTYDSTPSETLSDNIGSAMSATGADAIGNNMTSASSINLFEALARANSGTTATSTNFAVSGNLDQSEGGTSFVDVSGSSITITTNGRPVMLALVSNADGTASSQYSRSIIGWQNPSGAGNQVGNKGIVQFDRDGSGLCSQEHESDAGGIRNVGPANFMHIDFPAAGTYTYKVRLRCTTSATGSQGAVVSEVKFVAFEL